MKLAFVIDSLKAGGKERQLFYLLKELSSNHSILLIVFNQDIFFREIYDLSLRLITVYREDRYSIKTLKKLYNELKNFKPQIVHSWFDLGTILILPFLLSHKEAKLVSSIRNVGGNYSSLLSLIIGRAAFRYSSAIVSNSKKGLAAERLERSSKGRVIYNGIDASLYQRKVIRLKETLELNSIQFFVTMVGSFTDAKDYSTFIKAAKIVTEELPNVGFICVGEGKAREKFEKDVSQSINRNIFFLGLRKDIPALLSLTNVGVLLSKENGEGMSNSIMEYMASGLPVIATNAGGTPEIIRDGYSGFLVPVFDEKIVAERIIYLFKNREKAKELGENGRRVVETEFGIRKMVDDYVRLYKELIARQV